MVAIDGDRLRAELLEVGGLWRSVRVVGETGSTNADLADAARAGAPTGTLLVAQRQTAGRGRLDRSWSSDADGLALSLLVRPTVESRRWTWLPLITGMAVAEAVRRATDVPATLKWPNDVLVGSDKLAGILAQAVQTPDGPACVLGVGLNLTHTADQLPVPQATSLALQGARTTDATVVTVTIARAFALLYGQWTKMSPDRNPEAEFARAYLHRCSTIGRHVRVELPGETVEGVADGIDEDGRLLVRNASGSRAFGAGDVVHLR